MEVVYVPLQLKLEMGREIALMAEGGYRYWALPKVGRGHRRGWARAVGPSFSLQEAGHGRDYT